VNLPPVIRLCRKPAVASEKARGLLPFVALYASIAFPQNDRRNRARQTAAGWPFRCVSVPLEGD